jgi:hypothetical protein
MAGDFDNFADDAANLFGLTQQEAASLLDDLEAEGFDAGEDTLRDWMPEAFDLLTPLWDDYSEWELDPSFPDDDWLDAGEEWELTADYEED